MFDGSGSSDHSTPLSSMETPSFEDYESTSEAASRAMSGNTAENTQCERVLRRAMREYGLDFEEHVDDLPGTPDFVFSEDRLAVFCDGDFWHGRNWEEQKQKLSHGSNSDYWIQKIRSNMDRDERVNDELANRGWQVLRIWEGEILDNTDAVLNRIRSHLTDQPS